MLRELLRAGVFLGGLTLAAGQASAAEVSWDMPNEYPATNIHSEADQHFAKRLAELSSGEVEIVHHFGASLGYRSKDQFDAVADGAVPIADSYAGALSGIDPLFLLSSLPFLAATPEDSRRLFEAAKPAYEKIFEESGQKLLYVSPWPPSGLWGSEPLDSAEKLANLKMRTYDANGTVTFQAAGAAPVQLSFADVVPQLSTGGISAVLNSAEGGVSSKYWDYLSDFTEINYSMPLNMAHVNLDAFEDLTDAQQQAVLQAAADTQAWVWTNVVERVRKNYADMAAHEVTITKAIPDAYRAHLVEAAGAARDKWLADMDGNGEAILQRYEALKD